MPVAHCPRCGYPGVCKSRACQSHRESETHVALTDLATLCVIRGCLTPRAGANLCRAHDLASNPWRNEP